MSDIVITRKKPAHITTTQAERVSEADLEAFLRKAQEAYDAGDPIISDAHFDAVLEVMKRRFPKNTWLIAPVKRVAATGTKVKLPYYLPSLDKIKPASDEGLVGKDNATTKASKIGTTNYVVSEKLDGISGLYCNGSELYTQGDDGVVGRSLQHHYQYLKSHKRIPTGTALAGTCVRGELIIEKRVFADYNKRAAAAGKETFKTGRNLAAGITNKIDVEPERLELLRFVAYEVIAPEGLTPLQQFAKLRELGFMTAREELVSSKDINDENMIRMFHDYRAKSAFECDGIVIAGNIVEPRPKVGDNPKKAFAFKVKGEGEETTVRSVEWNVSKYGYIIPTVLIEPIVIDGVTNSRATGFHAQFIYMNGIGPGAVVRIIRSGDVIPKIEEVIRPSPDGPAMPPDGTWTWDDTEVQAVSTDPEASEEYHIARLVAFFTKLNTENVSEGIVRKMYEGGLTTLPDILAADKATLLAIPGFQAVLASKVATNIKKALHSATRLQLMAGSSLFGRGMGETKMGLLLEAYPDMDVFKHATAPDGTPWNKKHMPRGVSLETFEEFCENLLYYIDFLETIEPFLARAGQGWKPDVAQALPPPPKPANATKAAAIAGSVFVFTGFRNKELEAAIVGAGGKVGTSVSKKTTAVVAADPDTQTGKVKDATEAGVPVMSVDAFKTKYGI